MVWQVCTQLTADSKALVLKDGHPDKIANLGLVEPLYLQ
jgi:hypothetical protein